MLTLSSLSLCMIVVPFTMSLHVPFIRHYEDWRHNTNDEMLAALKEFNHIQSKTVENVMRTIDRRRFIERPLMNNPYWNVPQSLGFGSVMSSPKVHAQALEILKDYLKPGARVLDIGSGSGYLTACMAHMVGPTGKVYAIEHMDELVTQANKTMHNFFPTLMEGGRVEFIHGDGRDGYEAGGPYDVIYVGGAVHHYPYQLVHQLQGGGVLLGPVGPYGEQELTLYKRNKDNLRVKQESFGETKVMHLNSEEKQIIAWEPIIRNRNYPRSDPIHIIVLKKLRELEEQKHAEKEREHFAFMPEELENLKWGIQKQVQM